MVVSIDSCVSDASLWTSGKGIGGGHVGCDPKNACFWVASVSLVLSWSRERVKERERERERERESLRAHEGERASERHTHTHRARERETQTQPELVDPASQRETNIEQPYTLHPKL